MQIPNHRVKRKSIKFDALAIAGKFPQSRTTSRIAPSHGDWYKVFAATQVTHKSGRSRGSESSTFLSSTFLILDRMVARLAHSQCIAVADLSPGEK
jgi:hypothetical protein